jgi:hypothetical protein
VQNPDSGGHLGSALIVKLHLACGQRRPPLRSEILRDRDGISGAAAQEDEISAVAQLRTDCLTGKFALPKEWGGTNDPGGPFLV